MKTNFKILLTLLIIFSLVLSACGGTSKVTPPATKDTTTSPVSDVTTQAPAAKTKTKVPDVIYPIDQPAPKAPAEHVLVIKINDKETTLTREDILALEGTKDYTIETHGMVDGTFQTIHPVRKGINLGDLLKSQGYEGEAIELSMGGIGSETFKKPLDIIQNEKAILTLSTDGNWNDPAGKTGTLQFIVEGFGSPTEKLEAADGTKSPATIKNINYIEVKTK